MLAYILYGASAHRKTEKLELKRLYMVQSINTRLFDRYLRQIRKNITLQGFFKLFQNKDLAINDYEQKDTQMEMLKQPED